MIRRNFDLVWIIVVTVVMSWSALAGAQVEVGDFTIRGSGEIGGLPRSFSGSEGKAKFEEYRDVPETVVVPELELKIDSKKNDYYFEFDAGKVGRNDQNFGLRLGRYGLFDMEFEWDQIPHAFNLDTAATPFRRDGGNYTLSSKPPAAPTATQVRDWINAAAEPTDLSLYNGLAKFKLRYTPTPGWTFTGSYGSQNTNGDRAFGTVTNGFTNIVELAEPIDYQTHNIELGGEYAASWWTLGLKYNASLFHNSTSTLVWDNPFSTSTGLGSACANAANSTCQGQLDLYPSNQAHTFTLTGTAKLPLKTMLLGTMSYGWRLQDDKFLPFTINPAIGPLSAGAPLPSSRAALLRQSLDGDVRPTLINLTAVNRNIDRLDLKAYYRYYDFNNRSKKLFLPDGYVRTDTGPAASAAAEDLRSVPFAYAKQNLGMDASYQFTKWLTGKFAYGWERMHRESREVLNSNEHSFGPTLDIKPSSWVLFRASYRRYLRDAPNYDAGRAVVYETAETPEEIREDRLEALRKVDEAARTRNKLSLFSQISPLDNLTFHAGFDLITDDYPRTEIGTQEDNNYSPSVGFIWAPLTWASFFGDYNWERFDWKMRAMERNNVAQTPENDPARLWTSRGTDTINTFSLGTDLKLIENLLGLRLQYGFSYGQSLVRANGSTCAGCTRATDYPSITNRWHELLARFTYALHKNIDLKFGYYFNRYSSKDYGVDIMKLWMGDVDSGTNTSIWLGDRLKGNYEAHVGFIGVRFKF